MTRINAEIPVENLTDQHLLAEHREIKRITKGQPSRNAPSHFKLGKGHVLFFREKLGYCLKRYRKLHNECKQRGFAVSDFSANWEGLVLNDWIAPPDVRKRLEARIIERITESKMVWRYYGTHISKQQAIKLLKRK